MLKKHLNKIMALGIIATSIMTFSSIGANAEWKSDSIGWWNTEGSSYSTGWKLIDGNWYYFYSDGYMAHDTTIEGYYLGSGGAWTNSIITKEQAVQTVLNDHKYIDKPNDNDISLVKIYNKTYYRIYTHITYSLTDFNGGIKYRTESDTTAYVDIYTGKLYYGIES